MVPDPGPATSWPWSPARGQHRGQPPELEVLLDQGIAEDSWEPAEGADDGEGIVGVLASGAEVLRTKSFDELSETERIAADHVIRALAVHLPTRHSRRYRPSPYGRRFDQRRTLRASLRTQGEPFRRAWRDRRRRVRPLVLILDVSGSMSAYSRALMQFGFAAMRAGRRVEVFCFGTRLTRVTRALARSEPDDALREVAAAVVDWNGGTRIGASLKELLDRWSQHVAMRGAVVVLCSDGLERGDPALLAAQVARLSRLCPPADLGQPAQGQPPLRAAGPGHGRRPAARRRVPGRPQPRKPRVALRGPGGRPVRSAERCTLRW